MSQQGPLPGASPRRIGRYEVVGQLATGGMAEILLGRMIGPSGFERPVVIKRILPHLARQKGFTEMFLDEARIVAGIQHPNVVHVTELGHEDDDLYMVMEYLDGESVDGIMRRLFSRGTPLDYALAAFIVAEAAAGLHAAHELKDEHGRPRDVIHRDVSPQNVVVTYEGHVTVVDFGVAAAADRITRTETGLFKGKLEYASPEQCLGMKLDRRADVFALGILLYELTTGNRLFRRPNEMEKLRAICEQPIRRPTAVRPDYPAVLEEIVRRALHRDREGRYPTAAAMRRDLLAALRQLTDDVALEQRLAELMTTVFSERVDEKQAMLGAVADGSSLDVLPPIESDEGVDLPTLVDKVLPGEILDTDSDEPPHPLEALREHAAAVGVGLGLFLLTAGALSVRSHFNAPPEAVAPASIASESAAPPPAPPPSFSAAVTMATASREVTLRIETVPPHVHVFTDGTDRGVTPLEIKLPRGTTATVIEIRETGYVPVTERFVPDRDEKLKLSLRPVPRGGTKKDPYKRFN